jgi:hypothetical protein
VLPGDGLEGANVKFKLSQNKRRRIAYENSGGYCPYCGIWLDEDNEWQADHIVPMSQEGADDSENLLAACNSCNNRKGGRTPAQWKAYLRKIWRKQVRAIQMRAHWSGAYMTWEESQVLEHSLLKVRELLDEVEFKFDYEKWPDEPLDESVWKEQHEPNKDYPNLDRNTKRDLWAAVWEEQGPWADGPDGPCGV